MPSDKKEEVSNKYFFDHLQDDIAEDYPVEVKTFDAKGNDTNVDPVRNVSGLSEDEQPEQSIYKSLANNDVFDNPVCNFLSGTLHVLQQRGIAESDQQWNRLYLGMAH